ncbi:MAG TPA: TrkH family potassium uptake protein [Treponemataceae bacterium]|nr:TrkH family potassium uptake protein [Treponemataceae bacterium]
MIVSLIRLVSILLMIVAATMLLPAGVAFFYDDKHMIISFLIPFCVCFVVAPLVLLFTRKSKIKLNTHIGFTAVALCWISSSILGAVPLMLSGYVPRFANALFESASGFTTTGSTVLRNIDILPRSLNLWRMQMHWLGGMGIVALTVALLPLLGVGGFQLIKAENTGPEKDKITPKISNTAKILWITYGALTLLQTMLLMFAGMDFVNALGHTFATLGTGGFSSKSESIGAYNSATIDWVCTVFMVLAGVNFSLYYLILTGKGKEVLKNTELKIYVSILLIATFCLTIFITPIYGSFFSTIRYSAFQVVSILTTTGFSNTNFDIWPSAAKMILLSLMFIGGCSGSTAGGVKVIRWVVVAKQLNNETKRMVHPHGVFSIQLNGRTGRKDIIYNVGAFMLLYFLFVVFTAFVASIDGADLVTSITSSLALVGNIGPGFAAVGPTESYAFFSDAAKYWFCFAMIAGRLELYTMMMFFLPMYWKK